MRGRGLRIDRQQHQYEVSLYRSTCIYLLRIIDIRTNLFHLYGVRKVMRR